jgi:hypothetical protein
MMDISVVIPLVCVVGAIVCCGLAMVYMGTKTFKDLPKTPQKLDEKGKSAELSPPVQTIIDRIRGGAISVGRGGYSPYRANLSLHDPLLSIHYELSCELSYYGPYPTKWESEGASLRWATYEELLAIGLEASKAIRKAEKKVQDERIALQEVKNKEAREALTQQYSDMLDKPIDMID